MIKSTQKNRKFIFWFRIVSFSVVILILILGAGVAFISKNPEQSALFADNVLRPLIGDKAVINLEGFVFNIQDNINRLYKHQPAVNNYVSDVKTLPKTLPAVVSVVTPPPDIIPYVDLADPLSGEGKWKKIEGTDLFTTFIRTDSERSYSVVNLVYVPVKKVSIGVVAGTKYPGGPIFTPGPGMVPSDIQENAELIAAFNGGFKEKDGHFGMYVDKITYAPLKKGFATLYIYKDGHIELSTYDGIPLSDNVVAARQNGSLLVEDGKTSKMTSLGIDWWAGTATGGYITWRSGIGVTKNGDLIYAVGPSLTPTALADALRLATSHNAMELDINDFWVRFTLFTWDSKIKTYTWSPLTKGLADGGKEFLHGYEKDFFYIYKK
jgi:hypothetical protein